MAARPSPEIIPFPPDPWTRTYSWQASTSGVFIPSDYGVYVKNRTYSGSTTSGYMSRTRRQKMKLEPLNYSMTVKKNYGSPYSQKYIYWAIPGPTFYTETYDFPNSAILLPGPGSASHLSEAAVKARSRLAAQVNGMSINLGQAFAERKQTASLMASTAARVANAALALRKGRLGDFVNTLEIPRNRISKREWQRVVRTPPERRLANHWVAYQYGWKPLLQDLYGASELLSDRIRNDPYHHSLKSTARAEEKLYGITYSNGIPTTYFSNRKTSTRYASHFKMDSYATAALSATGLSNPALLAWELLPYSFVVDWFLPIGNYLESLTAFSGFTHIGGTTSNLTELVYEQHTIGSDYRYVSPYYRLLTVQWSAGYRIATYNRAIQYSWPAPSLPSFKNPIGGEPLQRVTTALALLTQVFGRK